MTHYADLEDRRAETAQCLTIISHYDIIIALISKIISMTTKQEVGLGAEEARWRRSEEFIAQSPGCRQGTILAPVSAWHYCPAAGPFWPWDILDRRRDLWVAAENRRCGAASAHGRDALIR